MLDLDTIREELASRMEQLEFEVRTLSNVFRSTNFFNNSHNFPFAHYGYMMVIFSRIDLLSRYWAGYERPQSRRMMNFMNSYIQPKSIEANRVAVQMWRHTLMHTGEPRRILDRTSGRLYTWRLDFGSGTQMPPHYSLYYDEQDRLWVLVMRLTSLVEDLKRGQELYLRDLEGQADNLQMNYLSQDTAIRGQSV